MLRIMLVPALLTAAAALLLLVHGRQQPPQRVMSAVVIGKGGAADATGPLTQRYGLAAGVIVDERVFKSPGDGVHWLLLDPYGDETLRGSLTDGDPIQHWQTACNHADEGSLLLMYSGGPARPTPVAAIAGWLPEEAGAYALMARKEAGGWIALQEDRAADRQAEIAARPLVFKKPQAAP
ncbi:hypothetical protein [Acanthopleuribacter pedis]|uniref:Uncharacterized protein n=1 Tax=Acanthopleuribacter pedis TaxID=442870 RepID=A0A8J7U141_9BACT|nr:hypothetical protein [Acanthopleuribacter pedis]MBO1317763.1 hypothetical protein [Acanthopleuribacter pedis]